MEAFLFISLIAKHHGHAYTKYLYISIENVLVTSVDMYNDYHIIIVKISFYSIKVCECLKDDFKSYQKPINYI